MSLIRRAGLLALAVLFVASVVGCTGKRGPEGPMGPKGDPGSLTRTVMTGHVDPDSTELFIPLPGFTIDDPSLVTVYVDFYTDEYDELPFTAFFQDGTNVQLFASLRDGGVKLYNCEDLDYVLMIVQ